MHLKAIRFSVKIEPGEIVPQIQTFAYAVRWELICVQNCAWSSIGVVKRLAMRYKFQFYGSSISLLGQYLSSTLRSLRALVLHSQLIFNGVGAMQNSRFFIIVVQYICAPNSNTWGIKRLPRLVTAILHSHRWACGYKILALQSMQEPIWFDEHSLAYGIVALIMRLISPWRTPSYQPKGRSFSLVYKYDI